MRIDTHQHFWNLDRGDYTWLTPDLAPLYRNFSPEDLKPLLDASSIDGTIAVQAADSQAETEYLLGLSDQHDWILGVVGWVDLESPTAPASIERLAGHPKLVGLRPMIQDIPDDNWMLRGTLTPALDAMIRHDLTFDALIMPRHLKNLTTFAERYSDLRIVIDHCAKPDIKNAAFKTWATEISAFGGNANMFCKLSGLTTEANPAWQAADFDLCLDHVIDVFGVENVMFGSDWPVLNLASSYSQWLEILTEKVCGNCEHVFYKTACRAYPGLKAS